jgi:hypothetical protein
MINAATTIINHFNLLCPTQPMVLASGHASRFVLKKGEGVQEVNLRVRRTIIMIRRVKASTDLIISNEIR